MANFKYSHLYSKNANSKPIASDLQEGEIALNIKKGSEAIYFKNTDTEVVELKVGDYYTKEAADSIFATITDLNDLADTVDALDDAKQDKGDYVVWTPFEYKNEQRKTIQLDNHYNISGKMKNGEGVNLAMVSKWDVADFGSTQLPINLNGKNERPTYNDDKEIALLEDVTKAKSEASDALTAHTSDTVIHVTAEDKTNWNGKADKTYVDTELPKKADKTYVDETFFASVVYDNTAKTITFYAADSESVLGTIDTTDFVKDGMVSSVVITGGTGDNEGKTVLKITFNTDAVKDAIEIPITDIFDANNYYTKEEVDGIVSDLNTEIGKKADKTYVDTELAKKADTATTYTKDEVDGKVTDLEGKITAEETRAKGAEADLATAIEDAKKVAITAATADYETNVLKLTLTNGENVSVKVDMKVTDAGNGVLLNSASASNTIILSAGTFE